MSAPQNSPSLGVCYYPEHWPEERWAQDAREMVALGLSWVRIGEFAWSRIEPEPARYDWDWLDRAIETLSAAGLKIVLGTPSATPPRWMLERFPDMLAVDAQGQERRFGSRRHYCFSHKGYREAAAQMAARLGERYGQNPHIQAWQIDNEYGCHDTTLSYSDAARAAFRQWLCEKYKTIEALNQAWGNVFWSMNYDRFEEIDLPHLTVTEPNPANVMDFRRFASDQVVAFNYAQCEALRAYTNKPLIHNYMGRITDFDHFTVGEDLEIASWDSYPLGFLEDRLEADTDHKLAYTRQGDPDFQAFHHDLYRAVGKGRWWVMEQQPGPVNWAPYNPAPLPGMVRLWTWEAFAHGAEVVSYFRWRQCPFAQEQMHAGLLRPDGQATSAHGEVAMLAQELTALEDTKQTRASIALVFDYASAWAWDIQPQGESFNYFRLIFALYKALRRLGLSVDIFPPTTEDFSTYKTVLIPGLFSWTDALRRAVKNFTGPVLIGPRAGSKTPDFQIADTLPPDMPELGVIVTHVESLRPNLSLPLEKGGHVAHWREYVETDGHVLEHTQDGVPVLVKQNHLHYLAAWPDATALQRIVQHLCSEADIQTYALPEGLRCREFGPYRLYMNYGAQAMQLNGHALPPASIRLINTTDNHIIIES